MMLIMNAWPELRYADWSDTAQTLLLWTQMAGKVRMALTPPVNHCWNVTLYVTTRGLTTGPIPNGAGAFEIEFDFLDHALRVTTTDGDVRAFKLQPMTVADFHRRFLVALDDLGIRVAISPKPCEVAEPIPFAEDSTHRSYDAEAAGRFWRVLVDTSRVFAQFRSEFLGKVSPVHYFWGAMDLAMTRFSGREAPPHRPMPGLPLAVVRDAYSHEVISAGFWPGAPGIEAAFYAYAYPEPAGLPEAKLRPAAAVYDTTMGEFLLPYEAVRTSASPENALMEFLQSTYDAAATLANWDRAALERRRSSAPSPASV